MIEDVLSFLDAPAEQPKPDATPAPVAPVVEEAPAAPVVEEKKPVDGATPATPAATPVVVEGAEGGEGKTVPLATFLDMRDEVKSLKAKLKDLEPTGEIQAPDPQKNPGEYLQFRENLVHLSMINERMNFSEKFAVKEHGKELVDKARGWALQRFSDDPSYEERVMSEADPYEVVIADFNKAQLATEFSDEKTMKEFRDWQASRKQPAKLAGGATPAPKPAAQAATKVVQPQPAAPAQDEALPGTIADAPSQGGQSTVPVGSGQAFDSLFRP